MGPECFCPGSFPMFQGSDVADLLHLEIMYGIEMATESFEVMNIPPSETVLCAAADIGNVLEKSW